MPITIEPQQIQGHNIRVGDFGVTVTRTYYVYGASGTSSALIEAFSHPSIPKYGDADPNVSGIFCRQVAFDPMGNSRTQAIVTAVFMPPDFSFAVSPVVRFSCVTTERETSKDDRDNNYDILYVEYQTGGIPLKKIPGRFRDAKRIGLLEFDRIEANQPSSVVLDRIGTINNTVWQGQPPKSWFCRTISFEKQLYRSGWRVHYEFEYDPELHVSTSVWANPVTGEVPDDIGPIDVNAPEGNGYVNRNRGVRRDFNIFTLPVVFT